MQVYYSKFPWHVNSVHAGLTSNYHQVWIFIWRFFFPIVGGWSLHSRQAGSVKDFICSQEQPSINNWWTLVYNHHSSSPFSCDNSRVCSRVFPGGPRGIKLPLSTVLTCLVTPFFGFLPSLSHVFTLLLVFPRITSQTNYLYLNPCLAVCTLESIYAKSALPLIGVLEISQQYV